MRCVGLLAVAALGLSAQTVEECRALRYHGKNAEAKTCFTQLARRPDPYLQALGLWGLGQYKDAFGQFEKAISRQANNAEYQAQLGRLLLERYTNEDAKDWFTKALKIDPNNTTALIGLALYHADRFDKQATEFATQAADKNPKLAEPREVLARLAVEDNNFDKAVEEADKALAISPDALDAMAVRAAVETLRDKPADEWLNRMNKVNPAYGEGYALIGHLLVLNRRYDDGIASYRKAIAVEPQLWSAHSQLGINLMRMGQEKEAYKELESAHTNGWRDAETTNSLRLMDSYKNFVTQKSPRVILKLEKKEAELIGPYFQAEAERALASYDKKYGFKLASPVQIEVYPNHEDFAVRTMGMPGLGALGVTFGTVVAMDSPSGRVPGSFHWASTMWHELSHVYVLTATKHRVPRWFTEGMAVHEETAVSPEWGDRLDPTVLAAIRDKKLLPIADLDRGFVRPTYPNQVIVSYFQAGRICDYIKEIRGYPKLIAMMHDYASNMPTPAVIEKELGMKPAEFDKQFLAWLDKETGPQVSQYKNWSEKNRKVVEAVKAKNWDDVIREGSAIRDQYPDYVESGNVYKSLADAYIAKGDKPKAIAELDRFAKRGGRNIETLKLLAKLQDEAGHKAEAAAALERITYVYLKDDQMHSELGRLEMDLKRYPEAIREFHAVVASNPLDAATAQYDLARAYAGAKQRDKAKEHVLLSLEAAPGFKPAQKLLLELSAN